MALVIRNFRGVPNMHWKQRLGGKRDSRAWGPGSRVPVQLPPISPLWTTPTAISQRVPDIVG